MNRKPKKLFLSSSAVGPHLNNLGGAGQAIQNIRTQAELDSSNEAIFLEIAEHSDLPTQFAQLLKQDWEALKPHLTQQKYRDVTLGLVALGNAAWLAPRKLVQQNANLYEKFILAFERRFHAAVLRARFIVTILAISAAAGRALFDGLSGHGARFLSDGLVR